MRKNLFMKRSLVFLLFLPLVLFFSCGGKTTTRPTQPKYKFTINGVVVKDLSLSKDIAYFTVLRDSTTFDSAVVKVGAYTLTSQGNGTYYKQASQLFNFGQNVSINISSPQDTFNLGTSVLMPGYFQITSKARDSVTSAQTNDVAMSFSLSSGASGYFKSIVKPDGSNGFTDVIPATEIPNTSIPRDAFYEGQTFVIGIYKIYLVAYRASFLVYPGMGFYLPSVLPTNNISSANGTIGAGVVAPLDSIKAVVGQ
jgi:hypothetical protein